MARIAVILTDGFADWECGLLMASARAYYGAQIVTASPGGLPVTSMGGLKALPDADSGALDAGAFDALVISGGTIWESEQAPDITPLIQSADAGGKVIAAICGGTLALARSGALDTVRHTSNAPDFLASAKNYQGHAHYRADPRAVRDGRVVTAAGTAPLSFTAEVYRALQIGDAELDHYMALFAAESRMAAEPSADDAGFP